MLSEMEHPAAGSKPDVLSGIKTFRTRINWQSSSNLGTLKGCEPRSGMSSGARTWVVFTSNMYVICVCLSFML